ncbi:MAG TPA: PqiC family protein [Candidatus Binataceae bacterium]|nr:PqiC family protein [Candidatus Binataceae bacterium]
MKRALTIFALCALLIAGCLSPRRDDSRFFVLSPAGADPATTSARPIVLGVGPIKLPGYLDRQEVVTRVAPNRLELSSTDRWAESLDTDFTRVLAQDLSTDLGTQRFIFYPWYATTHVDYQVKVDVYRFEAGADGKIDLTAHWQVLDGTGKLLIARDSSYAETAAAGDAGASAAALSRALGKLSGEIAAAIQSMPPPSDTSSSHA